MGELFQQILVGAAAVGAAAWLIVDRRRRRARNCDSCTLAEAARSAPSRDESSPPTRAR
ncbi:MAG TPA: hypothetical protein VKU85_12240 [bacterium]|nr:hypothetical protein [bacterium]